MKKIVFLGATALASTIAIASPAAAQSSASQTTMQAVCDAAKPKNNNQHTYTATLRIGSPSSATIEINRETISFIAPSTVPVLSNPVFEANSETIRGGSPNIHGTFKSTATYDGGSVTQRVTTATDTTYPYGCRVVRTSLTNSATDEPNGMQAPIGTYSFTERQPNSPTTVTVDGEDRTEDFFTDAVICNSPNKTSVWRVRNDYPGQSCTTAAYSALLAQGERPLRSNSVPGLSPARPERPDHNEPEPQNNLNPIPLFDDEG
jgi:hypothetical protein